MLAAEIDRRFKYHAPNEQTRELHDSVRDEFLSFAHLMNDLVPDETREMSLFWTKLEEAQHHLHAHIARNR